MKWLPTVVTVVLGLLGAFTPQVQGLVEHHPSVAVIFASVYAIIKGLAASPLGKNVQ